MARTSLSEDSLDRFENYLSSNPYREYSMSKPYFPRTSQMSTHSNRLTPQQQQSSMLAFHALLDNSKNSLTLDRLAYKLRMKSDLNIDTLRETDIRRQRYQRHQQYPGPYNHLDLEVSDITSSIVPSTLTKTFTRQPPSMTISSDVMKTLTNEDLNGVEGNAVRVGAIDDLIKRFRRTEHRLIRRPTDYLDSLTTGVSTDVSRNDRPLQAKAYQQHQERLIKQPQALTEYRFKTPTFPTVSTRINREPSNHQGLMYQHKIPERYHNNTNTDLTLLHRYPLHSPEQHRQRLNSLINHEQQPTEISSYDKRIQDSREKSLMRTEKQLCVFNKLTIIDPFNSNTDQVESTTYHLPQSQQRQHHPPPPLTSYIFPPVRPFGYFTKKTTTDDLQQSSGSVPHSPRTKKKPAHKKKSYQWPKTISDTLNKNDSIEQTHGLHMVNDRMKSSSSLSDLDDGIHNTTIDVDLNMGGTLMQNTDDDDEVEYL